MEVHHCWSDSIAKTDDAGIGTGILMPLYSRGGDLFLDAPRKSCQPPIHDLHVDMVFFEIFLISLRIV
jgi:hypothetical protein